LRVDLEEEVVGVVEVEELKEKIISHYIKIGFFLKAHLLD